MLSPADCWQYPEDLRGAWGLAGPCSSGAFGALQSVRKWRDRYYYTTNCVTFISPCILHKNTMSHHDAWSSLRPSVGSSSSMGFLIQRTAVPARPVCGCAGLFSMCFKRAWCTMSPIRLQSAAQQPEHWWKKDGNYRSRQLRRGWASALKGVGAEGQHRATPTRAAAPEAPPGLLR